MKPDPDTLIANAEGDIPSQALTGSQAGLFSKSYLSGDSVYSRLADDEAIHYLLVNRSHGVDFEGKAPPRTETFDPDGGYRAVAAITDRRVFFVVGREDGDAFVEVDAADVTAASLDSGLLSTSVTVKTLADTYTFRVKRRESSDPADAVEFIQQFLVPTTDTGATEEEAAGMDAEPETEAAAEMEAKTETAAETETKVEEETTAAADAETDSAGEPAPEAGSDPTRGSEQETGTPTAESEVEPEFISDPRAVTDEIREVLQNAARLVQDTDPGEDDLNEAVTALETARDDFQRASGEAGVRTEAVEAEIERVETIVDQLSEIRSAHAEAKRKLVLTEHGIQVPRHTLTELQISVEDAIEAADELGRSTTKLADYEQQIADRLEKIEADSSAASSDAGSGSATPDAGSTDGQSQQTNEGASSQATGGGSWKWGPTESTDSDATGDATDTVQETTSSGGGSESDPGSAAADSASSTRNAFHVRDPDSEERTNRDDSGGVDENGEDHDADDQAGSGETSDPGETDLEANESDGEGPNRNDLIAELRRVRDEVGETPKPFHVRKYAKYSGATFVHEFKTWDAAFDAAFSEVDESSDASGGESNEGSTDEPGLSSSGAGPGTGSGAGAGAEAGAGTSSESADAGAEAADGGITSTKATNTGGSNTGGSSTSGENTSTAGTDTTPSVSDEPTRPNVVAEIERVSSELGKRPTTSEFSTHSVYSSSDVYAHFDSWSDAVDAAAIDTVSPEELLDELRELEEELGYIPLSTDVDRHSQYSTYDYRLVFDSVDDALEEAGFDLEARVMEHLEAVVSNTDGKPKMADFEEEAPYSSGIVYKFFDGWDDAVAAATPDEAADTTDAENTEGTGEESISEEATTENSERSASESSVVQNELSERYESLRNLRTLCKAVLVAREDYCSEAAADEDGESGAGDTDGGYEDDGGEGREDDSDADDRSDPMDDWVDALDDYWSGNSFDGENYGSQQSDRNPFSMREYREAFGNGDRVTDFEHIPARPPSPSVSALLAPVVDADPGTFYLPVDEETGTTFPVVVESVDDLDRAVERLERLPAEPAAAEIPDPVSEDEGSEGTGDDPEPPEPIVDPEPPEPIVDPEPNRERSTAELVEVNGVTEEIANTLQDAGYWFREDLRDASLDELGAIDGVGEQIAMRIKLDVGG